MPANTEVSNKITPDEESLSKVSKETAEIKNDAVEEPVDNPTKVEVTAPSYTLAKFKLMRILQNNTLRKTIAVIY